MNSDKREAQDVLEGWILCKSKSNPNRQYYFNRKTGKSSWTKPQASDKSSEKPKSKKRKANLREKKKEEVIKKNLKRKNELGSDYTSPKKRVKEICPNKSSTSKIESPVKSNNTKKLSTSTPNVTKSIENTDSARKNLLTVLDESPIQNVRKKKTNSTDTTPKNLANTRLAQLRAQLNSEIQNESKDKSPNKKKRIPVETETSKTKSESPNTDSKSDSQNDTLSSISPSQFFAANKIISSMKAQLTEEYCEKKTHKDTFADIEHGICNQVTEYPYIKHPATPPQFSEASKLVLAIKSKLTSKPMCKDGNVTPFKSAKDRMESFRKSLNENSIETLNDVVNNTSDDLSEAMDVDFKEIKQMVPSMNSTRDSVSCYGENVVLVVDTNVFLHELDFIKNVLNSHIKGYSEQPTLLVPWRVINELDRLKDNNNGNGAICKRARSAMDYLYKSLPENNRIKGQSLRDSNSHIYPCEVPDDEILNCCLQQADRGRSVILLSKDKNLCNKAHINGVKCIAFEELKGLLESKPQPKQNPDIITSLKNCQMAVYSLLSNILENEMRAKYNNLWEHVIFKVPPWTLSDVLQCLLKHWIAVFNEVFPRIEHLITDLKNTFEAIDRKDPQTVSLSEMNNFEELCLEVARKCQIIPEYMELAKSTVERIQRKCETDLEQQNVVIEAFEGVWTIYSSYCAKLASCLGISHSIEDKIPGGEQLEVLADKLQSFGTRIHDLTVAMQGVLRIELSEQITEDSISRLEYAFNASLSAIQNTNASVVNRNSLRIFCSKSRNLLQEACAKFCQLAELLDVCKNSIVCK